MPENKLTKDDVIELLEEIGFNKKYLKAGDLAKIFIGTSQSTIASWADSGLLTRYKIGGGIYYAFSEVLQLIENSKIVGKVA